MADYGLFDRWLHTLALGIKPISKISFELDQVFSRSRNINITNQNHVFVCGLARSGSTILMRNLYFSGSFTSLTYQNMPFVLAPNIWKSRGLFQKSDDIPVERAHGDGIFVNSKSPECLDEVFFQAFDNTSKLTLRQPEEDVAKGYSSYIAAILSAGPPGRRYLSKNNNNVLRLPMLVKLFPNSTIVVPFRAPIDQAISLLEQHNRFCKLQKEDPFVEKYMSWLGHFEFGNAHTPLTFKEDISTRLNEYSIETLEYWLEIWCQCYGWLAEYHDKSVILISYEALCDDPRCWENLTKICACSPNSALHEPFKKKPRTHAFEPNKQLVEKANSIHSKLLTRFSESFDQIADLNSD